MGPEAGHGGGGFEGRGGVSGGVGWRWGCMGREVVRRCGFRGSVVGG